MICVDKVTEIFYDIDEFVKFLSLFLLKDLMKMGKNPEKDPLKCR